MSDLHWHPDDSEEVRKRKVAHAEAVLEAKRAAARVVPIRNDMSEIPPPSDYDAPPSGERALPQPLIRIGADLQRVVNESIAALSADAGVYQRDGKLTRIVRVAEAEAAAERASIGTPQLRSLDGANLKERLSAAARFEAMQKGGKWKHSLPPGDVVSAVAARGQWDGIRPITGIIETPSMRPDGTVIDLPGYDDATGYVYMPQRDYPALPPHPTLDDARRALIALSEPWQDFPVTSAAGRVLPVAAVLTLIARPAIAGSVPCIFFDASTRGSGKSLKGRAVTIAAQGRECAVTTWPDGDDRELEKMLGAYALRGASVILFDNVVGTFGGGSLDKVLTATNRVSLRVLGKSETPDLQWRALIMATGNNAEVSADTARRTLLSRLEPQTERPEDRDPTAFKIPQLEAWCGEHHPRLVVAALTLLRAYTLAGRPAQGLPAWGSFQPWADLVANAIVWAGGANVLDARATTAADEDEHTAALRVLLTAWPKLAPEGITAKGAVDALYSPAQMRGETAPDGFDDLRQAIEVIAPPHKPGSKPEASKLGYVLRRARGRVLGGCTFEKSAHGRAGVTSWVVREVGR